MKSFVFPGNIEPEILSIASEQVPYMRTSWFSELILDCEVMLLGLIDCKGGKVIPYSASGTAAMDSCVTSLLGGNEKKVLVINGGTFGQRWCDLCDYYGFSYDEFTVSFGEDPSFDRLSSKIIAGQYDVVFMQHHETSSGYLYDIKRVSKMCRQTDALFVVDAISSFLTDSFSMDDDGVDIAILSSQKGLNIPPGLSFVILGERVCKKDDYASQSYYLDWSEHLKNTQRGQTPFSPATHLFMQLHKRLKMIESIGVDESIRTIKEKANAFRSACSLRGWKMPTKRQSNCVTSVILPFDVRPFVEFLIGKSIYVMPCHDPKQLRVAHVGTLSVHDHLLLIEAMVNWEDTH